MLYYIALYDAIYLYFSHKPLQVTIRYRDVKRCKTEFHRKLQEQNIVCSLCGAATLKWASVSSVMDESETRLDLRTGHTLISLFMRMPRSLNLKDDFLLFLMNQRAVVAVIVWQLDLQLPMKSVPITTDVVGSTPSQFVSDLWQVGGFLRVLRFPPPIKLTATIQLKYCLKWR